jgi:DnaJ family protein B protein 12
MTNEANREEALKCLKISRQFWESSQKGTALKYASKSVSLFETADGLAWLEKIRGEYQGGEEEATSAAQPAKEEARKASPTGSANTETSKASYSDEQAAEVKKFTKISKNDYYAVLGVPKTASDADIKKAYRKVS